VSPSEIKSHIAKLRSYGAVVEGEKVTLYRGADVPKSTIKKLRYGDYLSAAEFGFDATRNGGASSYGKNVVKFELQVEDVEVTGAGEFQYKGKSSSMANGKKYPMQIYKAYNDAHGANFTASEIDKEYDVRMVASQALIGGLEEFDELFKKHTSHS
jgi:hypothetical protein